MIEKIATNIKVQGQKIFKGAIDNLVESGLNKNSSKSVFESLQTKADDTGEILSKMKKNIYNNPDAEKNNLKAITDVVNKTKYRDKLTDKIFGEGASGNIKIAARNNVLIRDIGATNLNASRDYLKAYSNSTLGAYGSKAKQMFGDYYLKPLGMGKNNKADYGKIAARYGATAAGVGAVTGIAMQNNDGIERY